MSPTDKTAKRAVVLDTSALVAGFDPFSISEEQYTVPSVIEEISQKPVPSLRFETAIESGKVTVKAPKMDFLEKARASASVVGDAHFLSETDIQVLALALELKTNGYSPLIATDDYSIQNVANQMKIEFASLVTFGIRRRLHWMRYCPACHRKYPEEYRGVRCEVCGTELKRKPMKENHIDH
jgi:UPF0271 protein